MFTAHSPKDAFPDIDTGVYVAGIRRRALIYTHLNWPRPLAEGAYSCGHTGFKLCASAFLYHVIKGRLLFERDEDIRISLRIKQCSDIGHKTDDPHGD